jgi:hypothetical protein
MVCIKGSRYYACGTYYHWGGRKCQCNTHKREGVETAVWGRVRLRLADPGALSDELLADRGNGHQEELSRLETQHGDLAQRRRRILEAIESGDFDLRALAEREAALSQQEKALSARIEALRARQTDAEALRARILDLSQIVLHFEALSPQEQNRCYARLLCGNRGSQVEEEPSRPGRRTPMRLARPHRRIWSIPADSSWPWPWPRRKWPLCRRRSSRR